MTRDLSGFIVLAVLVLAGLGPSAHSAEPPMLGIQEVPGDQLQLFWPQAAGDFALEAAEGLEAPVTWSAVGAQPVTQGTNWVVTLSMTGSTAYFRLRGRAFTTGTVDSATVSYLNAVPDTIPSGTVQPVASTLVSFLNALPEAPPTGTSEILGSPVVAYLNALPETVPTGTLAAQVSLPVSYLNATPQSVPVGTLLLVTSPIVSFWNQ